MLERLNDVYRNFILSNINYNKELPLIPNREKYKVVMPVITDTHFVFKEPTNRSNFIYRGLSYLYNIKDILELNKADYLIHTGDLFDRGTETVDTNLLNVYDGAIEQLTSTVKDSFIVFGNHEDTYSNGNQFFTYTDIKSDIIYNTIKDRQIMSATKPMFKAIDKLNFGNVEIHFMHYNKQKKYKIDSTKFNIGIFHDDLITFESKEKLYHHKLGKGISITDTDIFDNFDIVICGHIHTPLIPFKMANIRKTLVIVPGSTCQRTRAETHDHVQLPVICLNEEGAHIEYINFNLGDIQESIVEEIDQKNVKKRQIKKAVDKYKDIGKESINLEELIDALPIEVGKIISEATNELVPKCVAKYFG